LRDSQRKVTERESVVSVQNGKIRTVGSGSMTSRLGNGGTDKGKSVG